MVEKLLGNELELQSKIASLELRLQKWETSANDIGADSPESVVDRLKDLHDENLQLTTMLSEQDVAKTRLQG